MTRSLLCALLLAFSSNLAATSYLVIENALVYTVDQDRTIAEAVAIDAQGVIVGVGSNEQITRQFGPGVDLQGAMLLPGFQDVHLHAVEAGIYAEFCLLPQFGNSRQYRRAISQCAKQQTDLPWVIGVGVNMSNLLESVSNPLALADAVVSDRPLLVIDDLGHGAWGNSLAMRAAGFDKVEGSPPGSILLRNAKGELNGVVLESGAQVLIDAAQGIDDWYQVAADSLQISLDEFAANGITSVSDAGGYWPRGHEQVWYDAVDKNQLTVRASNALYLYPHLSFDHQIKELAQRFDPEPDGLLRFDQVKIYIDGILSLGTGLLVEPYESIPGTSPNFGFGYFERETLFRYAQALVNIGYQLHFHAVGDAGTRLALDAIEYVRQEIPDDTQTHRITHLYLVDQTDRPRFKELNVVADLQLAPSTMNREYRDWVRQLIGKREAELLPFMGLRAAGAQITISSDWDADELSPFAKLKILSQMISVPEAIELMTIEPAKLLQHADVTGSIEPGKFADLIVLDQNLLEVPKRRLDRIKVKATLLQGEVIYDPGSLF